MPTKIVMKKLFKSAIEGVDPRKVIGRHCHLEGNVLSVQGRKYDLGKYEKIRVLGSGKAASHMAEALEELLGDLISDGLVVSTLCNSRHNRILCMESDHPLPTQRSIQGGKALMEMMKGCRSKDLFIYLLSGGSSALIELPAEGLCLEDMQKITDLMLKQNLSIDEINTVRKHLSAIKGGQLGAASKAEGIVLTISDVIGDDLYSIGSAPLYADRSSFKEAVDILKKYEIFEPAPQAVREVLLEGMENLRKETPKEPSARISHFILASNEMAKEAMNQSLLSLGLRGKVVPEALCGDVNTAAETILEKAYACEERIIIFGGETNVKVLGKGKGGRNQQLALIMLKLACQRGLKFGFLSAGTDGIDGNSDAAGAMIDTRNVQACRQEGLDINEYLKNNDAYHFFKQLDSLLMTGPTGTNVMDVAILIKEK